ncbi:MAG: type II toxin-antitoxin system prevent-host-death family antitoxin [Kiritimatiellae bacterium]|nr:type II toxin-antitoxin system prevent-host-death family antitoxin [Kiritimatiellia bacterium]
MHAVAAPEIKRRGFGAIDKALAEGPVCIIRNNRPAYVVMAVETYREMEEAATLARVSASEAELREGRVSRGSADDLMTELAGE